MAEFLFLWVWALGTKPDDPGFGPWDSQGRRRTHTHTDTYKKNI